MIINKIDVPTPSVKEVDKWLNYWDSLPDYTEKEKALNKLFFGEFKSNSDFSSILIKCSTLNDFYSTNIFKVYPIARHIESLNIDEALKDGDETLVWRIANVDLEDKRGELKHHYFYSFATKYCSHHNPDAFPIYDSYVEKVLKYFRNINSELTFKNNDLKNYVNFKKILFKFQKLYRIEKYSLKDLDRYLWQVGKKYFPNNYGR